MKNFLFSATIALASLFSVNLIDDYQLEHCLTADYYLNEPPIFTDKEIIETFSDSYVFDNSALLTMIEEKTIIQSNEFRPSPVIAQINETTNLYKNMDNNSTKIGMVGKGDNVEIIADRQEEWYLVRVIDNSATGFLERKFLNIPPDKPANTSEVDINKLLNYVNSNNFESKTDYFVFTDIERQKTYIFKGKKGSWNLEKTLICSTGRNVTPTTRGLFSVSEKGKWFYSERHNSGAKYWTRFNGSYLFHSVAMDKDRKITDGQLGEKRSSGCVRLSVEDAKWIFENIPYGTLVFIN